MNRTIAKVANALEFNLRFNDEPNLRSSHPAKTAAKRISFEQTPPG